MDLHNCGLILGKDRSTDPAHVARMAPEHPSGLCLPAGNCTWCRELTLLEISLRFFRVMKVHSSPGKEEWFILILEFAYE